MADHRSLRPLERCVLRLMHDGVDEAEIARRFRRRPESIARVIAYTGIPRTGVTLEAAELRPLERRILKWRAGGAEHVEIGRRFRRSAGHVERIEQLAVYKLAR
jgi:DNA-binding CsgD family transcriptional regulator